MRLPRVQFSLRKVIVVMAALPTSMAACMEIARWKDRRGRCVILLEVYGADPEERGERCVCAGD
jgi:hypothetical protein